MTLPNAIVLLGPSNILHSSSKSHREVVFQVNGDDQFMILAGVRLYKVVAL